MIEQRGNSRTSARACLCVYVSVSLYFLFFFFFLLLSSLLTSFSFGYRVVCLCNWWWNFRERETRFCMKDIHSFHGLLLRSMIILRKFWSDDTRFTARVPGWWIWQRRAEKPLIFSLDVRVFCSSRELSHLDRRICSWNHSPDQCQLLFTNISRKSLSLSSPLKYLKQNNSRYLFLSNHYSAMFAE